MEKGNVTGEGLEPAMLVSLTAPKECARGFKGAHWLGGRFLPQKFAERYGITLPAYAGVMFPHRTIKTSHQGRSR